MTRLQALHATMTAQAGAAALRMSKLARLSPPEMEFVRDMSAGARHLAAHAELGVEGRIQPPQVLLSGWACHQRLLGDGRRQIIRFLLPGDIIGSVHHPHLPATCGTLSLTPVTVADARPLAERTEDMPAMSDAVALMARADELNLRDHVVRLGRQTAYERLVHLMLEFHSRLRDIGQVDGDSFALPLTQEVLADALGLSVVHINRTLQQVRRDRLLDFRSGQVTLLQPDLMRAMADWTAP